MGSKQQRPKPNYPSLQKQAEENGTWERSLNKVCSECELVVCLVAKTMMVILGFLPITTLADILYYLLLSFTVAVTVVKICDYQLGERGD